MNTGNSWMVTISLACLLISSGVAAVEPDSASQDADKAAILAHVHSIFQAFVDQDREKIRATHTEDWTGFQTGARSITRGLDAYMENIGFSNPMQRYEIEDVDIQVHGDTAVVYYIANWWSHLKNFDEYLQMRVRSVDIYRREDSGWIQSGSNIDVIKKPGALQKTDAEEFFELRFSGELP